MMQIGELGSVTSVTILPETLARIHAFPGPAVAGQGAMLPLRQELGFDDRRAGATEPVSTRVGLTLKPPVLRRCTITLVAVGGILAIVYGTLVPFNFQWHRPMAWPLPLLPPRGGDALANVLVYVPMGIFLRLLLRRRGSWWLTEWAASVALAAGLSYGTELLQSFLPTRVPSLTDTVFNATGACVGVAIAPAFQRWLRQFHAWVYLAIRLQPFSAACGLVTTCIVVYALAPFDVHPTPGHVLAALGRLHVSLLAGLGRYDLPGAEVVDKWGAASAYGVLAFLLVMAARESNHGVLSSVWTGLSRACCLAMAVEAVQLFTVSHVADWRDVELAAVLSLVGSLAAFVLVWRRPMAHLDPAGMIGPVVPLLCVGLVAWVAVASLRNISVAHLRSTGQWLPIMGSFHRSWDALLASYAAGFVNCVLASGLYVLWCRMRRRLPGLTGCVLTPVLAAGILQVAIKAAFGGSPDTGHLILAMVAGVFVHRVDRAVCGHWQLARLDRESPSR